MDLKCLRHPRGREMNDNPVTKKIRNPLRKDFQSPIAFKRYNNIINDILSDNVSENSYMSNHLYSRMPF